MSFLNLNEQTGIKGSFQKYIDDKNKAEAEKASFEKNRTDLTNQQKGLANQFKASMPSIQNELYSQIEGDAKRSLAEQQRQIKRNANSRGLLYSGLRLGDEVRSSAQTASQAAAQKSKVAPELQRMQTGLAQQAANTMQANYQDDLDIARGVFDQALAKYKSDMALGGAFMGMIGGAAGAYVGAKG